MPSHIVPFGYVDVVSRDKPVPFLATFSPDRGGVIDARGPTEAKALAALATEVRRVAAAIDELAAEAAAIERKAAGPDLKILLADIAEHAEVHAARAYAKRIGDRARLLGREDVAAWCDKTQRSGISKLDELPGWIPPAIEKAVREDPRLGDEEPDPEHCNDCGAEIIGAHGNCPGVPGGLGGEP